MCLSARLGSCDRNRRGLLLDCQRPQLGRWWHWRQQPGSYLRHKTQRGSGKGDRRRGRSRGRGRGRWRGRDRGRGRSDAGAVTRTRTGRSGRSGDVAAAAVGGNGAASMVVTMARLPAPVDGGDDPPLLDCLPPLWPEHQSGSRPADGKLGWEVRDPCTGCIEGRQGLEALMCWPAT